MSDARIILATLMLDMGRSIRDHLVPHAKLGDLYEPFFLILTLVVCNGGRGPCTVAKLARMLEMPRTTVARKLEYAMAQGWVVKRGRSYYAWEPPRLGAMIAANIKHVHRASKKLSNLDI